MVGDAGFARCLAATGVFWYRDSLVSVGFRAALYAPWG